MLPRWVRPRLGHLRAQYRPRPLTVPASYRRDCPPDPAPAVSLVTPSLNQGAFIGRAIDSVLAQGYPNLDYIVMDGGSTDETIRVLESYGERLRFESGPDGGPAAAIDHALNAARGEIMGWLNADDLLLPGTLSYVARYFAQHPGVDMVYGHRFFIDERDRDIGAEVLPRHREVSLNWFGFVPQETAFWRRSLWDRAGGIDANLVVGYDWDLFVRFQGAGAKIVRLPRFLGCMRIHPAQRTRINDQIALVEQAAIRDRVHGRPVSLDEAKSRVDWYRLRSLAHHTWYRARRPFTRLAGAADT